MTCIPSALPLHPVPWFASWESGGLRLCIAMRLVWLLPLVLTLGIRANADTSLSVTATAGAQSCADQAASASASCGVSSSVFVPAGQLYSPASASGTLSFGRSGGSEMMALGPPSIGTLDYSLQGNWSMGEGIGLSDQASVSLTAVLNLPQNSGNWTFYGTSYDATDDAGGGVGAIEIITSNGDGWISGSSPSSFTISHHYGTPFSVSLDVFDFVSQGQSSNDFYFDLRMVDPIAAPELPTWFAVFSGLLVMLALAKSQFWSVSGTSGQEKQSAISTSIY